MYVEPLASAFYLEKPWDIDQYETALKTLQQYSLNSDESRDLLWRLMQLF
ncbi:hypothetical protein GCM10009544_03670 [Streptomyces stramineus]|uniref:DUF5753 domain-containing protein n=1 Tax=Streptomyces stramineus TaxID=173861 RepID=A0ABP3J6S2_9ACTN